MDLKVMKTIHMHKDKTSKFWHYLCKIEKNINNHLREPDPSIHQTLNKSKKPEGLTENGAI